MDATQADGAFSPRQVGSGLVDARWGATTRRVAPELWWEPPIPSRPKADLGDEYGQIGRSRCS